MGRPKGSKNKKTLAKEALQQVVESQKTKFPVKVDIKALVEDVTPAVKISVVKEEDGVVTYTLDAPPVKVFSEPQAAGYPQEDIETRDPRWDIVVVDTVNHRLRDSEGKKLGHMAVIQRRSPTKRARNGGLEWASWAWATLDGVKTGGPERFELYDNEEAARKHAKYAAGCTPEPTRS